MTCPPDTTRIGGEFEFIPASFLGRPSTPPNLRLPRSAFVWTDLGRSALLIAAASILQRGGRSRAWLPAFACASVAQPFVQAGFDIKYYASNVGSINGRISSLEPESGDTLLFIHYFGHQNKEMLQAARELHKAGVWIIEDCVQASFRPQLAECSDFAITSYRKILPVVDGALLLSRSPIDLSDLALKLRPPEEAFVSAKMMAKSLRGASAAAEDFLPVLERAEAWLDAEIVPRNRSWLSSWVMERLDLDDACVKRRANWLQMSQRIGECDLTGQVEAVFKSLADDVVPLGFPVRVSRGVRNELRRFLSDKDIYCPVHWPLDHLPLNEAFALARDLEQNLLTLPIDQRMSAEQVERLVKELVLFFSQTNK
jgi:dTDP-4-amino-4,6-dideoxygalactose transaminase